MRNTGPRNHRAISRVAAAVVIVVILIIVGIAGGLYLTRTPGPTTSTSTPSTQSVTTSSSSTQSTTNSSQAQVPSTFTYETSSTTSALDTLTAGDQFDIGLLNNIYESLLWYNGANSTQVIPWLAQNYTISSNGMTANFTLRSGITFADGEPLNSSAVYFTFNRLLVGDGSTSQSYGASVSAPIILQLANKSLTYTYSGPHAYNLKWLNEVLAENFVQITGPLTFTIHIQNPNLALPYILSTSGAYILAPTYVMQHDVAIWNQTSNGYKLPYPDLSGNTSEMMYQYFQDQVSTCGTGVTPNACGVTYLNSSPQGSLAGTGPYELKTVDTASNDLVLTANPNYWGGPSGNNKPKIQTIDINYVPQLATRELDLQNAAKEGQAMAVDLPNTNLYDLASRNAWLTNGSLVSINPGIILHGPFTLLRTDFNLFESNVTNPYTGVYYTFQPFADARLRLAFADSVNLSSINSNYNNNLGRVALNSIPPGLPPAGAFNQSNVPAYSYNPDKVQQLLLSAMESPLTSFTFFNGTKAPSGVFDNTFGCSSLGSSGTCSSPAPQSITLVYATGDSVDQAVLTQIASVINNVSSTYNMGLTVEVTPEPIGQMITSGVGHSLYMWSIGWSAGYPWATQMLEPFFSPLQPVADAASWNFTDLANLVVQADNATAQNNLPALLQATSTVNMLANQKVIYFWTFYPESVTPMTSNVQGYYFNPALLGPFYFPALY